MIYTTDKLIDLLLLKPIQRELEQLHVHHTFIPSYNDFSGVNHERLQQRMKDYHVKILGWDDIGQHLTLFPDGKWIIGRDFEKDPASIYGHNTGAVSIEMIGNFDSDAITGVQYANMIELSRFLRDEYHLDIVFHRDYNKQKSCPGMSIEKTRFLIDIENWKL